MSNQKISLRTVFARNFRAMKIWQKTAPQLLPSIFCAQVASKLTPLAGIFLSGHILNALAAGAPGEQIWPLVALTLGVTAGLAAVTAALNRWQQVQQECAFYLVHKLLSDKKASMDFPDADSQRVADMLAQILQNSNFAAWGLFHVIFDFPKLCAACASILLGGAMAVSLFLLPVPQGGMVLLNSPVLVAGMLAAMVGTAAISSALENYIQRQWADYAARGRLGNRFFSAYGFFAMDWKRALDIRIYRQEEITSAYSCQEFFGQKSDIAYFLRGKGGLLTIAAQGIQVTALGLVYLFVCLKTWAGAFPIGSAMRYIGAVTEAFSGISALLVCLGELQANAVFLKDSYAYLDTPNTMYQGSLTTEKRSDRNYQVEFRDVSFRYPGAEDYALRHVNMRFKVGSRLAVVGRNGSGKTTFIKLLCRLYDPTEGQILLNGIDIRKYRYDDYMNIFSIVFQDFQLFAMPLGENVATSAHYDPARVTACLEQAGFGERLKTMGLDTHLYKQLDKQGVEVSGGEAQKIAIARALYKDAPFIVLDEPTAALDPVAEAEIYEKFDEIAGDKTAIYISHRLSSCKFCDEIAVFDNGQVVQQGTHAQLLSDQGGKYHALWQAQAQYYTKKDS